jgi:hypothetical protein
MVAAKQGYMDYVDVFAGDAAYDTDAEVSAIVAAAVAAVEIVVWEMTVPAQQLIRWGHGSAVLPMNQGYMWLAFIDATTAFANGTVGLCAQNNIRTVTEYVKRMSDTLLHSATNTSLATAALIDKQQMIALPEMGSFVREDSRLQIRYTISAALAGTDHSGFAIPITRYNA